MVTLAADRLTEWIRAEFPALAYVSISGNYCTDKKVSAVNGILGRGRSVIAEIDISEAVCRDVLKTTPARVAELNVKKNLVGTMIAGGVRTANAHYANILLAFYLATGQDAANIVEGSQGITFAEPRGNGLYFSVTIPNIVVGTVGSGKDVPYVRENLEGLGCMETRPVGENARRLAAICGATVLCGELSLMAAQTNPGELMRAHTTMERRGA
jgi:hydroxymethylglutaryl-CoA reductase (NADPH)